MGNTKEVLTNFKDSLKEVLTNFKDSFKDTLVENTNVVVSVAVALCCGLLPNALNRVVVSAGAGCLAYLILSEMDNIETKKKNNQEPTADKSSADGENSTIVETTGEEKNSTTVESTDEECPMCMRIRSLFRI